MELFGKGLEIGLLDCFPIEASVITFKCAKNHKN